MGQMIATLVVNIMDKLVKSPSCASETNVTVSTIFKQNLCEKEFTTQHLPNMPSICM